MSHLDLLPLTTYAAACLRGIEVHLNPKQTGYLDRFGEWCLFVPVVNGMKLTKTPYQWFDLLAASGFRSAWFGFEEGRDRGWGILMATESERYLWALSESNVSEGARSWIRAWCMPERSLTNDPPPISDLADLTAQLQNVIETLRDFAQENGRADEFEDRFRYALAHLDSDQELTSRFGFLFPQSGYSEKARRLAYATLEADSLGGMGSWNDWHSKDPATQARFIELTQTFAALVGPCLTAATLAIDV